MPLSDSQGRLSKEINSATIKELNKEVESLVNSATMCKRSPYLKVMAEQNETLGKYANEHGIFNAICPIFPGSEIKRTYLNCKSQQRTGKDLSITKLPNKKLGHPLLLGEILEKELKVYLMELGKVGGVVNAEICHG